MRWRRKPATATAFPPPESVWNDVVSAVNALDERDRARAIAVALEQENAHLREIIRLASYEVDIVEGPPCQ